MTDNLNRNDHIDWLTITRIDEAIKKVQARINALDNMKAELQASGDDTLELASIERDLKYENRRLNGLKGDREAMFQDWA